MHIPSELSMPIKRNNGFDSVQSTNNEWTDNRGLFFFSMIRYILSLRKFDTSNKSLVSRWANGKTKSKQFSYA